MKINKIIFSFCFLFFSGLAIGQNIDLNLKTAGFGELTTKEKDIVKSSAQDFINKYARLGHLMNDQDLSDFSDLFESNTSVLNDIETSNVDMQISIDDYFDKAYYFSGTPSGFSYTIQNARLKNAFKKFGMLRCKITFTKKLLSQLNETSEVVSVERDNKYAEISMNLEIDPLDPEEVKITDISGNIKGGKKVKKSKEGQKNEFRLPADNNIAIGFNYGLGKMANNLNPNNDFLMISNGNKSSVSGFGLYFNYRRFVTRSKARPKLYFNTGVHFKQIKMLSEIDQFSAEYDSGGSLNTAITTLLQDMIEEVDLPDIEEEDYPDLETSVSNLSQDFNEELSLSELGIVLGLEYCFEQRSSADGLFVGLNVQLSSLLGGNGSTTGTYDQTLFPNAESNYPFPDITDIPIDVLETGGYLTSNTNGETGIRPSANLSFGLIPYVRYQKFIRRKIGWEVQCGYHLGLSSYFATSDFSISQNQFLQGDSGDRAASILEDYFQENKKNTINISIGLNYLLN